MVTFCLFVKIVHLNSVENYEIKQAGAVVMPLGLYSGNTHLKSWLSHQLSWIMVYLFQIFASSLVMIILLSALYNWISVK
jgi:hypothetical protein